LEEGSEIPLLEAEGLAKWVVMELCLKPEETVKSLNNLLRNVKPTLHDASTGGEFEYKQIPDERIRP
jgi:hypothetical protein